MVHFGFKSVRVDLDLQAFRLLLLSLFWVVGFRPIRVGSFWYSIIQFQLRTISVNYTSCFPLDLNKKAVTNHLLFRCRITAEFLCYLENVYSTFHFFIF